MIGNLWESGRLTLMMTNRLMVSSNATSSVSKVRIITELDVFTHLSPIKPCTQIGKEKEGMFP